MRGLIFRALFDFLENNYSYKVVDKAIIEAKLKNDGAYTSAGNYDFDEFLKLMSTLREMLNERDEVLLEKFGEYTFKPIFLKLKKIKSAHFELENDAISFISKIGDIHFVEVKKLYSHADFPYFGVTFQNENKIILKYYSEKRLEHFAKGLFIGCGKYFNQPLLVKMNKLSQVPHIVEFYIEKKS